MRLFVGIRISEEIKKRLEQVEKELKEKIKEAKIVLPENLHLTLKFLGNVEDYRIEEINYKLEKIGEEFIPFTMKCLGMGAFPTERKIRVLWVGASADKNLIKLNKRIEEELEKIGFLRENKFKEHITIARFKSIPSLKHLRDFIDKYRESEFGEFEVNEFELIKSDLTPEGPIYTTLKKFKFRR